MSKSDTDPVFCTECRAAVRLERGTANDQLQLRCACGDARNVKVSRLLPEGWSA